MKVGVSHTDSLRPTIVSVVIPFGRELDLLRIQLEAIYDQEFEGVVQVLVACNFELVDEISCSLPLAPPNINVDFIDATAVRGPSYARNMGWMKTDSDFVLFCDADDVVSRSWISAMVKALSVAPLAGGRLSYSALNDADHASWNKQTTESLPRKFRHLTFVPSSNLGVRRKVLENLGGFDESLSCGEDIDFCWRAQYEGFELVFASDAVVEYRLRQDIRGLWRQALQYGISDAPLLLKHRPFGAVRPLAETFSEAASLLMAAVTAVARPRRWKKVVVRTGMLAGRIVGSARHRVWVI